MVLLGEPRLFLYATAEEFHNILRTTSCRRAPGRSHGASPKFLKNFFLEIDDLAGDPNPLKRVCIIREYPPNHLFPGLRRDGKKTNFNGLFVPNDIRIEKQFEDRCPLKLGGKPFFFSRFGGK
uniref:hypothetical protein n=1 Tax=Cephaleuros parasiticus TaxID=173370 RepID=UPI001EDD2173|nr:hypothetical protein MFQ79_pgp050 [Cephaleuros parasiticus]UIB39012.1 hypothetical protein [Cephaleuros parasiticus]